MASKNKLGKLENMTVSMSAFIWAVCSLSFVCLLLFYGWLTAGSSSSLMGNTTLATAFGIDPRWENETFGFRMDPIAQSTFESTPLCLDVKGNALKPLDPRQKLLVVIGTQKGGTTWLFNALRGHPSFVGPRAWLRRTRFGYTGTFKEMNYFINWPLTPDYSYQDMFPTWATNDTAIAMRGKEIFDFTLMDTSPGYMFGTSAAPRLHKVAPHARIVIVLRDPVARAYSAWKMYKARTCDKPARHCNFPAFETIIANHVEQRDDCLFNKPGGQRNWNECFGCRQQYEDPAGSCHGGTLADQNRCNLVVKSLFGPGNVGNYAAQIAWWLSFFPPEQFLIVSSNQMRDPTSRMQVLKRVMQHAQLSSKTPGFNEEKVAKTGGYQASAREQVTPGARDAMQILREAYAQPMKDLAKLKELYFPFLDLEGMHETI